MGGSNNNNNGNSGSGGGNAACGNQINNVTGVNINCGSKSVGSISITDQRSFALALWLGLWLVVLSLSVFI
jgi:hypothetical protein